MGKVRSLFDGLLAKSIPVFRPKRPKNPTLGVGERTTIERIERLCIARDVYGYIRLS